MAAISTENSSKMYLQFLFSIKHSSWLCSKKAERCIFMYVYMTTAYKKNNKENNKENMLLRIVIMHILNGNVD